MLKEGASCSSARIANTTPPKRHRVSRMYKTLTPKLMFNRLLMTAINPKSTKAAAAIIKGFPQRMSYRSTFSNGKSNRMMPPRQRIAKIATRTPKKPKNPPRPAWLIKSSTNNLSANAVKGAMSVTLPRYASKNRAADTTAKINSSAYINCMLEINAHTEYSASMQKRMQATKNRLLSFLG